MKPGDHQKITRKAVQLFIAHSPGNFSALLQDYLDDIVDGSKDADTKPLHIRSTNWHFYRANDLLQPIQIKILGLMPLTIYPTSDHILKLRIEQMHKECRKGASDDLFNLVGRILHHTQDMSTPAHVVPVYHGLDVLDLVEDALNVRDSFEDHSETVSERTLATMNIDSERFSEITASPCDLFSNYDSAARRTLKLLYEGSTSTFSATVNGEGRQLPWSLFWQPWTPDLHDDASLHGFGQYGILGRHFGQPDIRVGDDHYHISTDVYDAFYRQQIGKMLEDSIRALARVRGLMEGG